MAATRSLTIAKANEAPKPRSAPEAGPAAGSASTVVCEADDAVNETAPSPMIATTPDGAIAAVVVKFTIPTATLPAIPISPPPAPEVAFAVNTLGAEDVAAAVNDEAVNEPATEASTV